MNVNIPPIKTVLNFANNPHSVSNTPSIPVSSTKKRTFSCEYNEDWRNEEQPKIRTPSILAVVLRFGFALLRRTSKKAKVKRYKPAGIV